MNRDPFPEYETPPTPNSAERLSAWQTAIGLQRVDGLEVSDYLIQVARRNIEGEITIAQAHQLLDTYYESRPEPESSRVDEADKVSARITELITEQGFSLTPTQYLSIHRRLFDGIYPHAGSIRQVNLTKKEWVLDGDTVIYGGSSELRAALEYDLNVEREFSYANHSTDQFIRHFARFAANLWQIHVFAEGNTRTTAVFLIKYLKTLGFTVKNEPFKDNAWYFRNALVRANYTNLQKGVTETTEYLERFLRNALLNETNNLQNRTLHIGWKEDAV